MNGTDRKRRAIGDLKMRDSFGPELEMSAKGAARPLFCCRGGCGSPPGFIGPTARRETRSGYSGTFITFMSGNGGCCCCCVEDGADCCCCWAIAAATVPASVDEPVAPILPPPFFSCFTAPANVSATLTAAPDAAADEIFLLALPMMMMSPATPPPPPPPETLALPDSAPACLST